MRLYRILIFVFVFTSISLVNSSCSKTNTPTTVVGFWVGTYGITGSPTRYYISFDLRPDGTFLQKGTGADTNTYYGQGTYTVNGANLNYSDTTLNLSQTGAVEIGTGTYTAAAGTITGSWQNPGSNTVIGTFSVTKSE
jgi:hypothetical protein